MKVNEKAQELFTEMYNVQCPRNKYPMSFETAKQCALIAVDEIINALLSESLKRGHMNSMLPFYEEVKREIGLV